MRFGIILSVVFLATPCLAKDGLPLTTGIYVRVPTPCKSAPLADVISYWGKDSGFSAGPMECKATSIERKGTTFRIKEDCYDGQGDANEKQDITVTIPDARTVIWDKDRYRYCGKKLQM